MQNILTIAGLALTAAASFSCAVFLGWLTLTGLLWLLPARAPALPFATPIRAGARTHTAIRRARVIVSETRNRSGKMYTVRVA